MRIRSKLLHSLYVGVSALLLNGCTSSEDLSSTKSALSYSGNKLKIEPEVKVFHQSSDSSTIYLKFNTENLLYTKGDEDYEASVTIEIEPMPGKGDAAKPEKKVVSVPAISKERQGTAVMAKTDIFLAEGNSYNLDISIRDESNGKSTNKIVKTTKTSPNNRHNFIAFEGTSQVPLFTDRINAGATYQLLHSKGYEGPVYVNYYNRSFPLPPPPFAYYSPKPFDYTPDSRFTLDLDSAGYRFTAEEEGFYHFRMDTTDKNGFTLFISSEEFPEVQNVQNMIDPFRYLVSGKEYKKLIEAPALKAEIEKFWIDWAGDRNRARKNIQTYYRRVEIANRFFSSHVEGWKSDRGLIFIIYGEPNKVYKTAQLETWIYGEERNPLSITFRFVRVDNPFTENDYRLNREDYYKPSWYRSIEAWRNGRAY